MPDRLPNQQSFDKQEVEQIIQRRLAEQKEHDNINVFKKEFADLKDHVNRSNNLKEHIVSRLDKVEGDIGQMRAENTEAMKEYRLTEMGPAEKRAILSMAQDYVRRGILSDAHMAHEGFTDHIWGRVGVIIAIVASVLAALGTLYNALWGSTNHLLQR